MFIACNDEQIMGIGVSVQAAIDDATALFGAADYQVTPCTAALAQQVEIFGPVEWVVDANGIADVTETGVAEQVRRNPPPRPRACYFTDAFGQACQMTGPESAYLDSDALTIAGMAAVEAAGMTASGGRFEVR